MLDMTAYDADVVFQPALTPMEAAVLPAREKPAKQTYGTLSMIPRAWDAGERWTPQRAKIWVR